MSKRNDIPSELTDKLRQLAEAIRMDSGSLCQCEAINAAIDRGEIDLVSGMIAIGLRCKQTKRMHQVLYIDPEDLTEDKRWLEIRKVCASMSHGLCSMCPARRD